LIGNRFSEIPDKTCKPNEKYSNNDPLPPTRNQIFSLPVIKEFIPFPNAGISDEKTEQYRYNHQPECGNCGRMDIKIHGRSPA
jgi:hypothetical protein